MILIPYVTFLSVFAVPMYAHAADDRLVRLLSEAETDWEANRYNEAASAWRRSLLLDWPPQANTQKALTRANLGVAQLWLNQFKAAKENIEAALQAIQASGELPTVTHAQIRSALCAADVHLSLLNSGLQHCHQALEAWQALEGDYSIGQADILSLLAGLTRDHGKSADGEKLCRDAVRIYERRGAGQIRLASALGLLGQLLLDQKRLEEAATVLARAREALDGVNNGRHPALVLILGQTARFHVLQGAVAEAIEPLKRALHVAMTIYGNNHRVIVDLRTLQVVVLEKTGRRKEADRVRMLIAKSLRENPILKTHDWTVNISILGNR